MSKNQPRKQARPTCELAASSCRNQSNRPTSSPTPSPLSLLPPPLPPDTDQAQPALLNAENHENDNDDDDFANLPTSSHLELANKETSSKEPAADLKAPSLLQPDHKSPMPKLSPAKNEKFDQQLSIDLINPNNITNRNVSLIERLRYIYLNETLSDVIFVCGSESAGDGGKVERIPALKAILSAGSPVFMSMFYGAGSTMQQPSDEIVLPDIEPESFKNMLRYLYTDELRIEPDSVMSTLYVAKKYAIVELETKCVEFLKNNLRSDNAFMLLQQARLFDELQLADLCLDVIDKHSCEAFESECFREIDLETLIMILKRDTLGIREYKLHDYVLKWAQAQCSAKKLESNRKNYQLVLGDAINEIRYPLMTKEELAVAVDDENARLIDDDSIIQLFIRLILTKNASNAEPLTQANLVSIPRTLKFNDTPRNCLNGKEHSVSRFTQVESRWGYSGTSDRIRFKVDRKIFVVGFGLYGSIYPQSPYTCNIQLIHFESCTTCAQATSTFICDGSNTPIRVFFKEPIEIQPDQEYVASSTLKGSDSYYGTKGLRKVLHETLHTDSVTFSFQSASGNNNGTSVEDGQIPEIIFLYSC